MVLALQSAQATLQKSQHLSTQDCWPSHSSARRRTPTSSHALEQRPAQQLHDRQLHALVNEEVADHLSLVGLVAERYGKLLFLLGPAVHSRSAHDLRAAGIDFLDVARTVHLNSDDVR